MTRKELKDWISKPLEYHRQINDLIEAKEASGKESEGLYDQRINTLQSAKATAKIEIYEALKSAELPPKYTSILTQRYLQCIPWSKITATIGKSRQWTFRLHNMALDALTKKIK